MELIRKKICMENGRSRKTGLLPYIPFNTYDPESELSQCKYVESENRNGNWGGFVINPAKEVNGSITYENYVKLNCEYNKIIDILNRGVKAKRVVKNIFEDTSGDCVSWVTNSLSSGYCYSVEYDEEVLLYEYYVAKTSDFRMDGESLYVPLSKSIIPNDVEHINILSDDDFNDFMSIETRDYDKCKEMDSYIGKLYIPKNIEGSKVPLYVDYSDIEPYYTWLVENSDSEDCCVIKEWMNLGGQSMIDFFEEDGGWRLTLYQDRLEDILSGGYLRMVDGEVDRRCIPTFDIPILLTHDYFPESLAIPYINDDIDISYTGIPYEYLEDIDNYTTESELMKLRDVLFFYDDNDNELPGVFERFNKTSQGVVFDSAIYYYNDVTEKWEDTSSNVYPDEYKVVDIASAIPEDADRNDAYLVRYDNSPSKPMRIPFSINNPKNVSHVLDENGNKVHFINDDGEVLYECFGDFILNIDTSVNGKITFTYVIGGRFYHKLVDVNGISMLEFHSYIDKTGVKYQETFGYNKLKSQTFLINGVDAEVYYDEICFDDNKMAIENKALGLTREAYMSNIIAMPIHDYFSEGNEDNVMNAPIFRPDYVNGITSDLVADIDLTISRGAAAAFERHFKLSECNTLEDIENYGNNFFNL